MRKLHNQLHKSVDMAKYMIDKNYKNQHVDPSHSIIIWSILSFGNRLEYQYSVLCEFHGNRLEFCKSDFAMTMLSAPFGISMPDLVKISPEAAEEIADKGKKCPS